MKTTFEKWFKSADDEHSLLAQLTQMKKEIHEPMRDYVARYNKIIHKIPQAKRPTADNQQCFFINYMPLDVGFHLRRNRPADLDTVLMG